MALLLLAAHAGANPTPAVTVTAEATTLLASSIHVNASASGRSHAWFPHFTAVPVAGSATPALLGRTSTDDDGKCGGEKPCLPCVNHLSLDGGRVFTELDIEGTTRQHTLRIVTALSRPPSSPNPNPSQASPSSTLATRKAAAAPSMAAG